MRARGRSRLVGMPTTGCCSGIERLDHLTEANAVEQLHPARTRHEAADRRGLGPAERHPPQRDRGRPVGCYDLKHWFSC